MRDQVTSSTASILNLPQDLSPPFFAYGAFKRGELAYAQIREYLSSEPSPVFAEGHLKVRDGLPLFESNGSGNVRGFLLNFSPETGKPAYEKICAFEPKNIYFWTELRFGASTANVLQGKKMDRGRSIVLDSNEWAFRMDPAFEYGLQMVKQIAEESAACSFESAPPQSFDWPRFFRLQMAYLLLWSAIERFSAFAYGPALDPFAKVKALQQTLQTKRVGISSLTFLVFVSCTFVALSQTPTLAPVVVPDLAPILTAPDFWKADAVPFSFKYGGKDSAEILPTWQTTQETVAGETGQLQRYSYTDPVTHLKVTAEVRLYPEFLGVVDWVLLFRNDGTTDTPIIENIMPLRWAIPAVPGDLFVRHAQGSNNSADDFTPMLEHFGPWGEDHLESKLGRSSDTTTLPFFNLQNGDHGLIEAIGWTGNWKADFTYSRDRKNITMDSGMKETHLLLHPGEEIRTPRIVLMSWKGGTWQESQNRWRRLLFAHYTPQENGKPMQGPVMFGSWGSEPIADKLAIIQWVHDHKIPVNMYAVDAGWYGDSVGTEMVSTNPWWKNRGDWFPSKLYYPNGIKPLGDALKADGIGFSLWIEPETTMPDMKIAKDHPDWFIQKPIPPMFKNPSFLANLGNPAARKGLTDMVSDFITDFGMTWYRQDFNQEPEKFWRAGDTPDRIGMTEIKHIEGLYQMWDELLARHPGLRIDNCASGGRRLDIEMMSRSFSVWRTDNGFYDTIAEQEQTQDLAFWVPENMGFETYTAGLNGAPLPWTTTGPYTTTEHLYLMRLGYDVGYGIRPGAAGVNNDAWVAWIKQALGEYHEVQPYFYGDFYPLLPSSRDVESWTVWQWDRPESKDGLIMVLRRPKSPFLLMEVRPQHLNPDATYEVEVRTTYDKGPVKKMKGSELAHLQIHMPEAPSSTLIFYREK